MRNKKSQLLLFCVIVLFGLIITTKIIQNIPSLERFQDPINMSSLSISPIYIDGDEDWAIIASTEVWCSGSGIQSDPYVIDDVSIDGGGNTPGITIKNSNSHFIIQNCTIYNCGTQYNYYEGILLERTNNGIIRHNEIIHNAYGIHLFAYCSKNTISDNTISNNYGYGITISNYCDDNVISGNTLDNNDGQSIAFYRYCDNNFVLDNLITNSYNGIDLDNYCDSNTISGNVVNNNKGSGYIEGYGIFLTGSSNYNEVFNNTASFNVDAGIHLRASHYNIISENLATKNGASGILLTDSDNNQISGNQANENDGSGIRLSSSDSNDINNNIAKCNDGSGISLWKSFSNSVTENTIFASEISPGIYRECISEGESFGNTIENNICNECTGDEEPDNGDDGDPDGNGLAPAIHGAHIFLTLIVSTIMISIILKKIMKKEVIS